MDVQLPGSVLLAIIALLCTAVVQAMLMARYRRTLECRLDEAHATIRALNAQLHEATQPPAQFARSRLRHLAVDRFIRLRLAAPRRTPLPVVADSGYRG